MATQTERIQLLMDPETVMLMDKLRGDRSRGECVRQLIRQAWEDDKREFKSRLKLDQEDAP